MSELPRALTPSNIMHLLQDCVDERGRDYVYNNPIDGDSMDCRYLHATEDGGSEAGCIFGCALLKMGMSKETLANYEGSGIAIIIASVFRDTERWFRILLGDAQGLQDNRNSWGEVVAFIRGGVSVHNNPGF